MYPVSSSTRVTSVGISNYSSSMTYLSIPIKKGKGASATSIIFLGRIGISTFFQHKGNKKEIRAMAEWVSKALWEDINSTFFSNKREMNISITDSASRALNKHSISDFYN